MWEGPKQRFCLRIRNQEEGLNLQHLQGQVGSTISLSPPAGQRGFWPVLVIPCCLQPMALFNHLEK